MSFPSARLVIFDLSGTSVQLSVNVAEIFQEVFRAQGVAITHDMILPYRGASKRETVSRLVRGLHIEGVHASTIYDDFQQRVLRGLAAGKVTPIPGIEQAFEALRAASIRVVLTTGFDTVITSYLMNRLGWTNGVDGIVTGDDVTSGRPAPDTILLGMRRVSEHDRGCVVVVGDTVNDMKAGRRAGVGAVVGVLTGAHGQARLASAEPTAILSSAADLPAWLGISGP